MYTVRKQFYDLLWVLALGRFQQLVVHCPQVVASTLIHVIFWSKLTKPVLYLAKV